MNLPSTDAVLAHAIEHNAPEIDMDDAAKVDERSPGERFRDYKLLRWPHGEGAVVIA